MRFQTQFTLLPSLAAIVFAAGVAAPARPVQASDIEVFFSQSSEVTVAPNVLFILDTSQSMYTPELDAPEDPYDPTKEYPGACGHDRLNPTYYWTTTGGTLPDCGADWAGLSALQFDCPSWKLQVATSGLYTKTSRVAQHNGTEWIGATVTPDQQSLPTACQGDGAPVGISWSAKDKGKDVFQLKPYTFYDGNWLNWAATGNGIKYRIDLMREAVSRVIDTTEGIKVGLMRFGFDGDRQFRQNTVDACENEPDVNGDGVIDAADEATLSSNGAPVIFPVTDLGGSPVPGMPGLTVRDQLRYQLGVDANNENMGWVVDPTPLAGLQPFQVVEGGGNTCPLPLMTPGGRSPIGAAMREAFYYYSGQKWSLAHGKQAAIGSTYPYPSVEQSLQADGETYQSPIQDTCAKNFIILLSDGTTEQDNEIDGSVERLPGFQTVTGSKQCDRDPYLDATGQPPPSECVDDMAEYMRETDMRPGTVPGLNNVITYTIGLKLGTDTAANAARNLLQETASRGGGKFYEVGNVVQLEDAIGDVIREILTENTSFSAPAVTVNAFNRTQNLNSLYMSLFRPAFNYRWLGNIKRYELDPIDGDILDSLGNPAVDPANGFFRTGSRSFWSTVDDGNDIAIGGAASQLDDYDQRTIKTLGGGGMVDLDAAGLTDADLGIQSGDYVKPGVSSSGPLTAEILLDWFYGKDVRDEDGDTITDETRHEMGDPLHSRPATVIYGGTAADPDLFDDALYVVTNDGVLHAFDPTNPADESQGGKELWAFVPLSLVDRLRDLYYNQDLVDPEDRGYGLDANIRVHRIDNNNNGIIETADEAGKRDKVYLFFGERRGGGRYLGMDVSNKNSPKRMWSRVYNTELAGQSWSSPQPAKVRIGTTEKLVLIFGGGYDDTQDQQPYAEDSVGRGIYMVDALTGNPIWRAGPDGGADLQLDDMLHSIPGDVRVIDLTGDGFADRMYAADLGGRIWRFDIINGEEVSDNDLDGWHLVEGGLIASLGNAEEASPRTESNTLRFFYSPDPSLITKPGPTFINIAIGSGHREMPATDLTTENWFFSVRDYNVFRPLHSDWYKDDCTGATTPCHQIVQEDDLVDLTDIVGTSATAAVPVANPGGAVGWRIHLLEDGEKVLAEARTFQEFVFFTTYSPVEIGETEDTCGIKFGLNKLYVVNAVDARPLYNYDAVTGESTEDRSKDLAQGSISPEVVFVFPTPPVDPNNPNAPQPAVPPICLVGLENCGFGLTNPPVRTYWRQRGVN